METDYEGLAENIGIAAAFLALSDGIDGKRNSDCELLYEARAALQAAAEMQKRLKELEEHINNLEEGWAEQNEEWEREVAGLEAETNLRCACEFDPEGNEISACALHAGLKAENKKLLVEQVFLKSAEKERNDLRVESERWRRKYENAMNVWASQYDV